MLVADRGCSATTPRGIVFLPYDRRERKLKALAPDGDMGSLTEACGTSGKDGIRASL